MKKNGFATWELLVVIGIFSIAYFVVTVKISSVFNVDYETEMYDLKIDSIENNAALYGSNNIELFEEEKEVYITVEDLVVNGLVINNDGIVIDPRDETKKLNDIKIKLVKEDDKITAKALV